MTQRSIFKILFYISIASSIYFLITVEFLQIRERVEYLFYYFLNSLIILFYIFFIKSKKYSEFFFISIIAILLSFYFFEIYNSFLKINQLRSKIEKTDISKINFYKKNKKINDNTIIGFHLFAYLKDEKKFLPLTHKSKSNIIMCNENGYYSKFTSDRYGFNNDDRVWNENVKKILLIGDSFVQGSCVNRPDNINSRLRKLNNSYNFINFGIGGTSIINQYAIMKEFYPKNVNKVFLFYYEGNDLSELKDEVKNPILLKYFNNENFSQDLKSKINLSDQIYKKFFVLEKKNYLIKNSKKNIQNKEKNQKLFLKIPVDILLFKNTRKLITFLARDSVNKDYSNYEVSLYEKTLLKFKKFVEKNNGELIFVYLPEWSRYNSFKYYKNRLHTFDDYYYKKIINIVKKNEIKIIDIHQSLFLEEKDPLNCFPYKESGHYNKKCYFKISSIINKSLN